MASEIEKEIEKEFRETSKILLGTELQDLDFYGAWLGRRVPLPYKSKSVLSGKETWLPPPHNYLNKRFNESRIIAYDETEMVKQPKLSYSDLKGLGVRELVAKAINPIAYYCGDFRYGEYENIEKCSGAGGGQGKGGRNLYYCEDVYFGSKNCAYCNFTSFAENMFGCNAAPLSKFCIHVYNSANLTRCFEADGCTNSSDLYFCHNCESMSNAILCFNEKNLRYAVGNVEVGPVEFARVKKLLLDYVISELKAKKRLDVDIYNVGCL